MTKICLICGEQFETIPHGESRKYCFKCSPSYSKGDNQGRGQTITAIRHALKNQLLKHKGNKCEKCGYSKCNSALEFHHINPQEKEFNISKYTSNNNVNIEGAIQEIEKCALLCANCHREYHFLESEQHISYEDFLKMD